MQRRWKEMRVSSRLIRPPGVLLIAILMLALGTGFSQVTTKTIPLELLGPP